MLALGKREAKRDDRTLKLADYLGLHPTLPKAIPLREDYGDCASGWDMLGNDRIGDCTCVSAAHQIQGWTAECGAEVKLSTQQVLAVYSAVTGYDPADPLTDCGAYLIDVLKYWRRTGMAGHRCAAFASVHPTNTRMMRMACYLFGGLMLGLSLPRSAQVELAAGKAWEDTDDEPGTWGGHAVNVVAYEPHYLTCVTWGRTQRLSNDFVARYCDESFAVLSRDWIARATQRAPNGFDATGLQQRLDAVTA